MRWIVPQPTASRTRTDERSKGRGGARSHYALQGGGKPKVNVEALRVFMLGKKVECRPVWKPMHKQPVYAENAVYTNGVEEELFKVGFCLPAGPYVTDEDVKYIVECIKEAIG